MTVVHRCRQRMGDTGADPAWIVLPVTETGGDRVGGLEADAGNVARQPVRIGLDRRDRLIAIGLEDPHRPRRTDAVAV